MIRYQIAPAAVGLALLATLALPPQAAQAATLTVDRFDDPSPSAASACTSAPGDCSLRGAVIKANRTSGADTIRLQGGTYRLTRAGSGNWEQNPNLGDIDLLNPVTIIGASGGSRSIVDASGANDRAFDAAWFGTYRLTNLVIQGGRAVGEWPNTVGGGVTSSTDEATLVLNGVTLRNNVSSGGAVYSDGPAVITGSVISGNTPYGVESQETLTITNSRIVGNRDGGIATGGPGSLSRSTVANNGGPGIDAKYAEEWTITASTISGNAGDGILWLDDEGDSLTIVNTTISGNGGTGVKAHSAPAVTIDSSTIVGNRRGVFAGLSESVPASITYRNSIIALNGTDCGMSAGALVSGGFNLDSDGSCSLAGTDATARNPRLGALADNGGPTRTHALLAGSPAIDSGAVCPATDQRGVARPRDGDHNRTAACDAGSYER